MSQTDLIQIQKDPKRKLIWNFNIQHKKNYNILDFCKRKLSKYTNMAIVTNQPNLKLFLKTLA